MTYKEANTIMTKNLLGIRCFEVTTLMEDHGVSLDTMCSLRDLTRDQGEALVKRFNATSDLLTGASTTCALSSFMDKLAPIHDYGLENMANGRCYVGQATSLSTRFAQHRRKPPTRMANDAALHVPFEQYFVMSNLGIVFGKAVADRAEAEHIAKYAATGPKGYNTLCLGSGSFKKYWFLKKRKLI
ncbi:TPA: hypothetical protein ACH3X1_002373 [Trebouxia sp. C0004]